MQQFKQIIISFTVAVLLFSCSEYGKVLKTGTNDEKYEYAVKLYEDGKYYKAFPLFDELLSEYKVTSKAPDVYYYYTYCQYNFEDYIMAAHHFENFAKKFKTDPRAEEFQYMSAYCHYKDSPKSSLEQNNTYKSIEKLQLFIEKYPNSSRVAEANDLIDELRYKIEEKEYNNAKGYYNRENYKAAIYALGVYLKDYPASKYTEEASFLHLKANYLLATNSVQSKKEERLENTIKTYYTFVDKFGSSSYIKDAEKIFENTKKAKELLTSNK